MREEVYSLNNVTANSTTYSDSILEAANNRWSDSRDPYELRFQRNNIGGAAPFISDHCFIVMSVENLPCVKVHP